MCFKLALKFGVLNPCQVMQQLNSRQLACWIAYDKINPFGQEHTDYLLAQLYALTYNINRSKGVSAIDANHVLGKTQELSEEHVEATLRSFLNHGTN